MITEREYRIECINKRYPAIRDKKVVIYGTGINAKLIIDHADDIIDIIGLMDESQTGRELFGYRVLSKEEIIDNQPDAIILAAKIDSAIEVYKRISDFCNENNIAVYDLYGNSVIDVCNSVIMSHDGRKKAIIDSSDVVSVDLNALFKSDIDETQLFGNVWESKFKNGTKAFIELRKIIERQQEKSYGSLESIYGVLKSYLNLSDDEVNSLKIEELELRKQDLVMVGEAYDIVRYALEEGKTLFFFNETIFSREFWLGVFNDKGIETGKVTLLNRSESGHNKYNGLYREVFEIDPGKSYIHVGNDYYADGIAAAVYGFKSIVLNATVEDNCLCGEGNSDEKTMFERIREYCTDAVKYSLVDCKYEGYTQLFADDSYYVFLKKDAIIKPGWLEQLVSTVKKHNKSSIICSRITSDNGTVLYAGDVIKDDLNAQKAQMVSGFLPLYDYVKEVSKLSIVSFLVKKEKWDKAESEATELRSVVLEYCKLEENKKAIYQPLSEVICDIDSIELDSLVLDIKAESRPKILVTDNMLTQFDHDAGSRCTWFYLREFHKLGFDVTLMAQNFSEIQPYVMLIQQAGICVIYGDYYRKNWKKWLAEENDSFRYVYAQRPESTAFFYEEIRKYCSSAKVFYFAHDLHFLRLYREYEITGNRDNLVASEKSKAQECSLIEAADVVHVVGSYEQEYLHKMYPDKMVRNIPLYIYERKDKNQDFVYNVTERKDILYVGSFGHPPNLDAVVWFAEKILPRIVMQYPNLVWHVVGANPPADVQKYQGKNLVLHGFLSDDDLTKLYSTCRMVVVPLRYGAGVKGKILEASYNQVPIVTTPIGAEGIPQDENNMAVCGTAEEFADTVCNIYQDEERLCEMSEGGRRLIEKYYSESAVKDVLSLDMPEILQ